MRLATAWQGGPSQILPGFRSPAAPALPHSHLSPSPATPGQRGLPTRPAPRSLCSTTHGVRCWRGGGGQPARRDVEGCADAGAPLRLPQGNSWPSDTRGQWSLGSHTSLAPWPGHHRLKRPHQPNPQSSNTAQTLQPKCNVQAGKSLASPLQEVMEKHRSRAGAAPRRAAVPACHLAGMCSSRGHTHRHKLVVLQLDDVSDTDVHPLLLPQAAEGQQSGVKPTLAALLPPLPHRPLPLPAALCRIPQGPVPPPGCPIPTTLTLRRSAPETAGCSPGCRFYGGTGCRGEETAASAPLGTGPCVPPPANAMAPGTARPPKGPSPKSPCPAGSRQPARVEGCAEEPLT